MHLHVQSYPLADWRQDPRVLGMSPFLCWPCGQGQALAFHTTVDEVTQRRRGDRRNLRISCVSSPLRDDG